MFGDPNWDWTNFDLHNPKDFDAYFASNARLVSIIDAMNPDLSAFRNRGGKLIHYHGWADNNPIAPRNSVNYFNSVASYFGYKPDDFYRLFMAPGMTHCFSPLARGPNVFDTVTAIENWVEKGVAPAHLVASHLTNGVVDRTRLCPYPDVARYTGTGSIDDAGNFVCTPAVDIELLPTVLDLRADAGWRPAFITIGGGFDPEGWAVTDLNLEGAPAGSLSTSADGRTVFARSSMRPLSGALPGAFVTLNLEGVLERDGARVGFGTDATVQVLR